MSTTITDDSPWRMTVSDEHGIRLGYAVLNGDPRDERTPDIWDVRVRDDKAAELVDGKDAARALLLARTDGLQVPPERPL